MGEGERERKINMVLNLLFGNIHNSVEAIIQERKIIGAGHCQYHILVLQDWQQFFMVQRTSTTSPRDNHATIPPIPASSTNLGTGTTVGGRSIEIASKKVIEHFQIENEP